jgi:predicted metal-dependent phosphoesterase TrpH
MLMNIDRAIKVPASCEFRDTFHHVLALGVRCMENAKNNISPLPLHQYYSLCRSGLHFAQVHV